MSKNLIFKILIPLAFLAVAVLWLLSAMDIIELPLTWIIAAFAATLGLIFILKGFFQKSLGAMKKLNILLGAGFFVAAVFALVGVFIEDSWVLPIIAIIVIAAVLLSILVVGGKKWDQGDNQNVGYKNYYQRKKEEEEQKKKDE